ncbi:caspase family protein [Mesorhizobium sp. M0913]|uniref:caspase family protein n=1 Tax=Mesorhizobium sp. M0913 TaxID=2957026 RepID=UPI003336FDB8
MTVASTFKHCLIGCIVFAATTVLVVKAQSESRYALLIGVNKYPNLESALVGPANDVALALSFLLENKELGFNRKNITVLANGPVESDGIPDRKAIFDAMDALAARVEPGDFVYLQFGGHGSRQKARNPASEPDGLDEIFLPADAEPPTDGVYLNVMVDDDIGAAIDRIRARGAFVFAVFDSCNSSSATRGAAALPADYAERFLPDALYRASGQPQRQTTELRVPPIEAGEFAASQSSERGGLVTFFAAQTIEPTPEMLLPRGVEGPVRHGLFSYTLFSVLARKPGLTYRELAQGMMQAYAVGNFDRPTPLFEGDLDHVVFAQQTRSSTLQWPIKISQVSARLPAGSLQGLGNGTVLAVLRDPLEGTDKALGYIRVENVHTLSSVVTPLAYAGLPAPQLSALPAGSYARPVETALSFQLSVELPTTGTTRFADAVDVARRAIANIAADKNLPMNLRTVEAGENADLRLVVASAAELYPATGAATGPRLWFLPPDGRISSDPRLMPHSIGLGDGLTEAGREQARRNLMAIFRATSLSRLSQHSTLDLSGVDVAFSVRRERASSAEPIDTISVPVLSPGDQIDLGVENKSSHAIDLDVLLIGPDYSIQHMIGERFQSGDHLNTPLFAIGNSGFGLRRMLLVMREVPANSEHTDLGFLEQGGVRTRGPASTGPRAFDQLIDDIAHAPTRAAVAYGSKDSPRGSLEIFTVESVPR